MSGRNRDPGLYSLADAYAEYQEQMADVERDSTINSSSTMHPAVTDSDLNDLGEDVDPLLRPASTYGLEATERIMRRQRRHFNFEMSWRAVRFMGLITIVDLAMLIVEFVLNHGWNKGSIWANINGPVLIKLGAKVTPLIQRGQVWRLFTPMFLHVGFLHFFVNALCQIALSLQIEASMGPWKVGFVYLISGIGGNLASAIFLPSLIEVGASSSMFGLVGVYFIDLIVNWSVHPSRLRNLIILIVTTVISFALGFFPNIDNFAHIGGFITGLVSSAIIMPSLEIPSNIPAKARKQFRRRLLRIALACVILAALFTTGLVILLSGLDLKGWCPFCEWISCLPIYPACKNPQDIPPEWLEPQNST